MFNGKRRVLNKKKIGPIWLHPQTNSSSPAGNVSCDEAFLMKFEAVSLIPMPIPNPLASLEESDMDVSFDNHQGMQNIKTSIGTCKVLLS